MADDPPFAPTFIRAWRQRRGLSLDQLAFETNIDKGNLSKLERGEYQYKQETMERIAKALNATVADLVSRPPSEPSSIFEVMKNAPATVRRQIEAAAEAILKAAGEEAPAEDSSRSVHKR